jgi:hypothetical protein
MKKHGFLLAVATICGGLAVYESIKTAKKEQLDADDKKVAEMISRVEDQIPVTEPIIDDLRMSSEDRKNYRIAIIAGLVAGGVFLLRDMKMYTEIANAKGANLRLTEELNEARFTEVQNKIEIAVLKEMLVGKGRQ